MEYLYLQVSYSEKDEAKALGAKWDVQNKKWYITLSTDPSPFKKWLPSTSKGPNLKALAPLYFVESHERCWKCHEMTPVVTLASSGFKDREGFGISDDFFLFHDIQYLPKILEELFRVRYPTYFKDYSKTSNAEYWMNHCACGAKLGDFFMYNEPGGAFFPTSKNECQEISLIYLESLANVEIDAQYSSSSDNLILEHAQQLALKTT